MIESIRHRNKSIVETTNRVIKLKRNKTKYGQWGNDVWNIFTEFSERSSIHGIRYLSETTFHWSERFWWLISLVMSVVVCIYFIHQVWLKLTPVVITFNDQATPISEIPFPTVTICSDNAILPRVLNYSHYLQTMKNDFNVSDEIVQQMYSASAICGRKYIVDEYISTRNVQIDRNILPHLKKVSPDLLEFCEYVVHDYGYYKKCNDGFSEVLTPYGLCYTFNHLSSAEIYRMELLADDFPRVEPFQVRTRQHTAFFDKTFVNITYPYRMQRSGEGFNLMISIPKSERIFDRSCSQKKFRNSLILFIHSAEDVQQISDSPYIIPIEHKAYLTVRPNIISTDDSLFRNYNKYQRKCITENENELKFFQKYTQSNCHFELLINETLKTCNCSHFWMPRENDTKVCLGSEIYCSYRVELEIIKYPNSTNKCLPACKSISYDADIYFSKLHIENNYFFIPRNSIYTEITISFKAEQYFGMKRSELYGKIDFIAGCGGILGLFMGVSFLSIIEIIYFATVRVFCKLRNGPVAKNQPDCNESGLLEMLPNPLDDDIGALESVQIN